MLSILSAIFNCMHTCILCLFYLIYHKWDNIVLNVTFLSVRKESCCQYLFHIWIQEIIFDILYAQIRTIVSFRLNRSHRTEFSKSQSFVKLFSLIDLKKGTNSTIVKALSKLDHFLYMLNIKPKAFQCYG